MSMPMPRGMKYRKQIRRPFSESHSPYHNARAFDIVRAALEEWKPVSEWPKLRMANVTYCEVAYIATIDGAARCVNFIIANALTLLTTGDEIQPGDVVSLQFSERESRKQAEEARRDSWHSFAAMSQGHLRKGRK